MRLGCLLEIVIVFALVAVLSHDQGTSLFLYMFVLAFPMALVRHFRRVLEECRPRGCARRNSAGDHCRWVRSLTFMPQRARPGACRASTARLVGSAPSFALYFRVVSAMRDKSYHVS